MHRVVQWTYFPYKEKGRGYITKRVLFAQQKFPGNRFWCLADANFDRLFRENSPHWREKRKKARQSIFFTAHEAPNIFPYFNATRHIFRSSTYVSLKLVVYNLLKTLYFAFKCTIFRSFRVKCLVLCKYVWNTRIKNLWLSPLFYTYLFSEFIKKIHYNAIICVSVRRMLRSQNLSIVSQNVLRQCFRAQWVISAV